ncbi:MAG: YggS family pyridoxal phosphate-dependent enzyme [Bacteroidales bacterium]|nr:YggS family pyridoxal phosphate-dependent enzyme [Bacteroidales bacterium]
MISENLARIRATLPKGVTLVAVSKFHPAEMIAEAYRAGQRIFGESRENEFRQKVAELPSDIEWHFIGHLQSNKVKYIAPYVSLIHSIDTEKLLDEVEKQAIRFSEERIKRFGSDQIGVLLQLHVAQEETKSGFSPKELLELLENNRVAERWPHVRLRGLMGMASFVNDPEQWRKEFRTIVKCRQDLLNGPLMFQNITEEEFSVLSFGMSEDYPIAIEEGSNMVRIGTAIFGPRNY